MIPQWIIERKRDGAELAAEEIGAFLSGFTRGEIPDYQMAALAMAIYFRGMTPAETSALTRAMWSSGRTVDTSGLGLPVVDKHSTGGIGDKVSLLLAPLAACGGVAVPMISGRGLGLTGGTLDKLEAIPGYRTRLSEREMLDIVRRCGCSIVGASEDLAPADRKLYALRDVTGTVPSIPLIVASIMSKKLAAGLNGLVLDVKCGRGAFMRTRPRAAELADGLLRVARDAGLSASALITGMDQPLGRTAGNALEVREAVRLLQGAADPADVRELTLHLAADMLTLAGRAPGAGAALALLREKWDSGEALARFRDMVSRHGGDPGSVDDPERLGWAPRTLAIRAPRAGVVRDVNAEAVGRACLLVHAGRTRVADTIDPLAGVSEIRKIGEPVSEGEPLAILHGSDARGIEEAAPILAGAFSIADTPGEPAPLILERRSPERGPA